MTKKTTIILRNVFSYDEVEIPCTNQCSFCLNIKDSFACKIYPATFKNNVYDAIPDKYKLGQETCPDFIQAPTIFDEK